MNIKNTYFVLLSLVIFLTGGFLVNKGIDVFYGKAINDPTIVDVPLTSFSVKGFTTFSSEDEFKEYLSKTDLMSDNDIWLGKSIAPAERAFTETDNTNQGAGYSEPNRVSETNVQVVGIDEPDIVKTNGKDIYFSKSTYPLYKTIERILPQFKQETKVISAFPPENLAVKETIEKSGELLLGEDVLVVFSDEEITGYNLSNLKEEWNIELNNSSVVEDARLLNDKIYLVIKQGINTFQPCPIKPLSLNKQEVEVRCVDIYRPEVSIPTDVTYTVFLLDIETGKTEKQLSFVGNSGDTTIYMSENALYVAYAYYADFVDFSYNFYQKEAKDLVPKTVLTKIQKLLSYEISSQGKISEMNIILQNYYNSLSDDERMRIENEMTNRMSDYYKGHKRELERLGIVKIDNDSLRIESIGETPGRLLNQFSLDEYNGYLRVAVTLGQSNWRFNIGGADTANDIYVLDDKLEIKGFEQDLGLTEQIYSVRFIGDKGYLVTFRQTDPFYVLDLKDPENPTVKGELKIPGFSSYLHPISENLILGIGKEGSKVKLSLFDVSDPANPKESSKYLLEEYWTDVLNNHHAFLIDAKHNIFFLPGNKGGYIFSYDNKLRLERAVSNISPKRAIYINDYLYIISDDKIVVLNENGWEEVNDLDL